MTEQDRPETTDDASAAEAATEAAQNVVDEVTSWEYSGERETIEGELDRGLDEAGVALDPAERERVVDEIDEVKDDETAGSPDVGDARPADQA
ncbi:hypothetical protein KMZ32_01180 [Phycicoccus sp. MAQZ13P-2]|uniref:hypothetical protein n=1 Tax=Phycicoccus mangrovi TaxID=2840470 RepID=UPI001BFFF0E6|nr:hypothetical protein [Phycicoccus mangrovi]MBT9254305.1 hypothetical protein [Phycicoccus mangrovi]MBT9272683.1 hypothetical protein [Phycicoccus mangrovi]